MIDVGYESILDADNRIKGITISYQGISSVIIIHTGKGEAA
jgi:hypothetical protein